MTRDQYIQMLARDYLDSIAESQSTAYNAAERAYWNGQRSIAHNELIRQLGPDYARPFDMRRYCSDLLHPPATPGEEGR